MAYTAVSKERERERAREDTREEERVCFIRLRFLCTCCQPWHAALKGGFVWIAEQGEERQVGKPVLPPD